MSKSAIDIINEYKNKSNNNNKALSNDRANSGSASAIDIINSYQAKRFAPEIEKQLNDFNSAYKKQATEYGKRFGKEAYRADANDYYDNIKKSNYELNEKAKVLKENLNKYKSYYGEDYVNQVSKSLDDCLSSNKSIIKNADLDRKYVESFKDEEDYNTKKKEAQELKKLEQIPYEKLHQEIDMLNKEYRINGETKMSKENKARLEALQDEDKRRRFSKDAEVIEKNNTNEKDDTSKKGKNIGKKALSTILDTGAGIAGELGELRANTDVIYDDAFNNKRSSKGFKDLTLYFSYHPNEYNDVEKSYDFQTQQLSDSDLIEKIAKTTGVDKYVIRNYIGSEMGSRLLNKIEDTTGVETPFTGEIGYNIGRMVPELLIAGAGGAIAEAGAGAVGAATESSGIMGAAINSLKEGSIASLKSAVKSAIVGNPTTALMGLGAAESKYTQLASQNGYKTSNAINAIGTGLCESFTESALGFSDINSYKAMMKATGSKPITILKSLGNYVFNSSEEGLEEVINVPLEGMVDKLTTEKDKRMVGKGGVFDIDEMIDNGVDGAVIGAIMGGVGAVANAKSTLNETKDIKSTTDMLNKTILNIPEEIRPKKLNPAFATSEDVEKYMVDVTKAQKEFADNPGKYTLPNNEEVSEDVRGKNLIDNEISNIKTSDGKEYLVKDVVKKDGAVVGYNTTDGNYVDANSGVELDGGDFENTVKLTVKHSEKVTNDILNTVREVKNENKQNFSTEGVVDEYNSYYDAGKSGIDLETHNLLYNNELINNEQAMKAYELGVSEKEVKPNTTTSLTGKGIVKNVEQSDIDAMYKMNGASVEKVDWGNLTKQEKAQVNIIREYCSKIGIDVKMYQSTNNQAPNGFYNGNGCFYLDIKAGTKLDAKGNRMGKAASICYAAHELVHIMQVEAPEYYEKLKNVIISQYKAQSPSLLAEFMANKMDNFNLSEEEALNEVIADACQEMLNDTNATFFKQIANEDASLGKKIVDILDGIINKIKTAIKGLGPQSAEAVALTDVEEVRKAFNDCLMEMHNKSSDENIKKEENTKFSKRNLDEPSETQKINDEIMDTAENDNETEALTKYEKYIREANSIEEKIDELGKQIKEESFKKGSKDNALIEDLKNQKAKQEEKLSRKINDILNIEENKDLKELFNRKISMQKNKDKAKYDASYKKLMKEFKEKYKAGIKAERKSGKEKLTKYKADQKLKHQRDLLKKNITRTNNRVKTLLSRNTNNNHVLEEYKPLANAYINIFAEKQINTDKLISLIKEYKAMEDGFGYDKQTLEDIIEFAEQTKDTTFNNLSREDLTTLKNISDSVIHMIIGANRIFIQNKQENITKIGDKIKNEIPKNKLKKAIADNFSSFMKTPFYLFESLGDTMSDICKDMAEGSYKWAFEMNKAKDFITKIEKQYNVENWIKEENTVIKGITNDQALSLYASWLMDNQDNTIHIKNGGYRFKDNEEKLLTKDIKNVAKNKIKNKIYGEEYQTKTDEQMKQLEASFTDEQKAYVKDMLKYNTTYVKDMCNKTSRELNGINKFNKELYYPIKSASEYNEEKEVDYTDSNRIKNQSFTKHKTQQASNPIILEGFRETMAKSIDGHVRYAVMSVPIDNLNRVMNYKGEGKSLRDVIRINTGKSTLNYIKTFRDDINNNIVADSRDKSDKLISLSKKGAVFASLSTAIQQGTAIVRAMYEIDLKYVAKTPLKKRDYNEMYKYSGTANIKKIGRFDTGTGMTMSEWLYEKDYDKIDEKIKAFIKDGTNRDTVLSYLPSKCDEITWAHLWNAVKREMADKDEWNGKTNTETFLKACGKRFDYIVNKTQVYDSTISKSHIMRSKSPLAKGATAFMAEPTLTVNMLYDGIVTHPEKIAKAVTIYTAQAVLVAATKSIVTAGRDDDDDKSYLDKYVEKFTSNLISELFILNAIPYVKDIVSIFEGYEVERPDMALISDLNDALQNMDSDNKSLAVRINNLVGALAAFTGIPYKNISRDFMGAINIAKGIGNESQGIGQSIKNGLPFNNNKTTSNKYNGIYKDMKNGDTSSYEKAIEDKDEATVKAGITKQIKKDYLNGKITDEEVYEILNKNFGTSKSEVYFKLKGWKEKDETGENYNKYDDLISAMSEKDQSKIKEQIKYLTDHEVSEASIKSAVKNHYKKEYMEASEERRKQIRNEMASCDLLTIDDIVKTCNNWTNPKAKDTDTDKYFTD